MIYISYTAQPNCYTLQLFIQNMLINFKEPHRWCNGWRAHLECGNCGFKPGQVKPKTIKLVFVPSSLSTLVGLQSAKRVGLVQGRHHLIKCNLFSP